MKATDKLYRCAACGEYKQIKTNHTGECFDYCKACSWRGVGYREGENYEERGGPGLRRFRLAAAEGGR
jgi:hypothetical protein